MTRAIKAETKRHYGRFDHRGSNNIADSAIAIHVQIVGGNYGYN